MEIIPAPLKGKAALITGGSRGIGAGIAQKLAEQGCTHIAITYSANKAKADEVLASIQKLSPAIKTHSLQADLLDPEFGEKTIKAALTGLQIDYVDIVVSNAANGDPQGFSPVASLTKKEWDDIMTANAWSPLSLARAAIQKMRPDGRIIFISSAHSKTAGAGATITYAASKAALDSVSKSLAASWAMQYGVTVNSISVGATMTDTLRKAFEIFGKEVERHMAEFSLLKRYGEVREIAEIVAFIASPAASWIVGNQIPANGGGLSSLQS